MARFCGNCGAELEENARVCGHCGTPVEGAVVQVPHFDVPDPEKQQKTQAAMKKGIVVAVALAVCVAAFLILSNFTGQKGFIRKVMTAYENYDIDALVDMSSDLYFYDSGDAAEYYFENSVGGDLDAFESSVGHNYKLSYKIDEIYTMSDRKLSELIETLEMYYSDFDSDLIDKVVVADLTVTAKQDKKTDERAVSITMTKENGSWKVLYIE